MICIKLLCTDENGTAEICGLKINGVETELKSDEDAHNTASFYLPSSFKFKKATYITFEEWVSCGDLMLPDGTVISENNMCEFDEETLKTSYNRGKLIEIP
ncbi:MAG: hypothetical protein FWG90_01710 [Oscillospiraceae bacterium]|nr:hypothetical protein [Oscillospiraceae bacterium]